MTLRRYLTRLFGGRALGALLALTALLQLLDLLDRSSEVLARGGGVLDVLHYAALRSPTLLGHAVPLAVLVGGLLAFWRLAATSEMAALRAAGVGAWRVLGALLPACALAAAAQGALLLGVAPRTERALADWWDARAATSADTPLAVPRRLWFRNGAEIVAVDAVSLDGGRLEGVLVVRRERDGTIAARIEARGAAHDAARGWVLREARVVRPGQAQVEPVAELAWPDGPGPEAMRDLARPTEAQPLDRLLAGARGEGAVSRGARLFRNAGAVRGGDRRDALPHAAARGAGCLRTAAAGRERRQRDAAGGGWRGARPGLSGRGRIAGGLGRGERLAARPRRLDGAPPLRHRGLPALAA